MMIGTIAIALVTTAAEPQMPIIGWAGGDLSKNHEVLFRAARGAGFTHLMQWAYSPERARGFLDIAQRAGVKLVLAGRPLSPKVAEAVKDHPALAMYHVFDEPHKRRFEELGRIVREIRRIDPNHHCFCNMTGILSSQLSYTGFPTHEEFMRSLYDAIPISLISIDVYPITAGRALPVDRFRLNYGDRPRVYDRWYESLEVTSAFAREKNLPFAAFAQSMALGGSNATNCHPAATIPFLRLQHYSNLAYGAQMLEYFTFRSLKGRLYAGNGPICDDGTLTPVYDRVRTVNRELQVRAFVFLGAKVKGVWHTGVEIPGGTRRLSSENLPQWATGLETPDGGAVVSLLEKDGVERLVVVNRSPVDELTLKISLAPGIRRIMTDGTSEDAALYGGEYWLDPGAAEIFIKE